MRRHLLPLALLGALLLASPARAVKKSDSEEPSAEAAPQLSVPAGTHVPLVMVNSISSKHSQPGDPVYLESVFPVAVGGRILIPAGSHVSGTVTFAKRPGRIKGRGKLSIHLEQIILPNGVIRSLEGRPGALDGRSRDDLDRETGTVRSPGEKGEDAGDVATATAVGASIGAIAGSAAGRAGAGLAGGSAVGAGVGVAQVLLTRGAEARLDRGTHVEMVLGSELTFDEEEVQFEDPIGRTRNSAGRDTGPRQQSDRTGRRSRGIGGIGGISRGRLPL